MPSNISQIIKDLYLFNRTLLGEGYDSALECLKKLLDLRIIEVPSGTKLETWEIPQEWIVRDAWVKFNGEKIIDFQKDPLSLWVYSQPFWGKVSLEELKKHLVVSDEMPDATPYHYVFYKKDWGFCLPKNQLYEEVPVCVDCDSSLKDIDPSVGKIRIDGVNDKPIWKDRLREGEYEVFIDAEFRNGTLKIGEHTIKGKPDREILLFAHLDHPFQANDNLSGVACLVDLAFKLKDKFNHTIKIIFCPETIGSIAYGLTQDISKVDFVVALDCAGNDNSLLIQKPFEENKLDWVAHLALLATGISFRKGLFRHLIGSDEYFFNDPKVGIPGIMISRWPYNEYHTSADIPEIVKEDKILEVQKYIENLISIFERNYVPERLFRGPLMRSKYGFQNVSNEFNRLQDYLIYLIDGKRSLADICVLSGIGFDYAFNMLEELKKHNLIKNADSWTDTRKGRLKKVAPQKP
jgi:aminopeptidase-like protein